jgi:hypothetical protein
LLAKSVILAPEDTSQEILSFLRESNCKFKIRQLIINPSKLVELSKLALQFKKKHSSILDIRLIESDGKKQVCIIAHAENLPSISKELASKIKLPVIHIQASQLLAPDSKLLETIRAGTSLLKEVPALPTKKLFRYSTKHLKGSEKVKFHYELSGRDKEGIIAQTQSEFFAKSIIIAPDSKADVIRRFLQKYSCEFVELEVAEISHGY